MRIDAHQHFWDPARHEYPWMAGDAMDPVRRAFTPDDLRPVLRAAEIDGTILVQTMSSVAETREFLQLAAATDFIAGVVGWVDLTSPAVGDDLDELLDGPGGSRLVGIRHQVHDEADPDWLGRDDVRRGLAAVQRRGLSYDLLVRARELPAAVDVVRAFPDLRFVLDHVAKSMPASPDNKTAGSMRFRSRTAIRNSSSPRVKPSAQNCRLTSRSISGLIVKTIIIAKATSRACREGLPEALTNA